MEIVNTDKKIIDKVSAVYIRIKQLRDSGAKMKDIAEGVDVTSSVLSAIYSTILPSIIDMASKSDDYEYAIEESIQLVNNVSRKKFFELLSILDERLSDMDVRTIGSTGGDENIFFGDVQREASKYITQANNYSGIYLSYSRSSYKDALKVEPYLVSDIEKGEIMPRVTFINEQGVEYCGVAMFTAHQIGYIFINEQRNRTFGLRNISLQLPLFDNPSVLKGIYLSHDFNHNPIARRILFVKHSNSADIEELHKIKPRVVTKDELNDQERGYYDYTCCEGDFIRSIMYFSPQEDNHELIMEKKMLSLG